ncbi:MAG: sodium/glutamate symporter [Pseudomonadales bacterium]
MEFQDGTLQIGSFFAVTIGIIVLFVGKRINEAVSFLREFSIPEPVTGGLLVSVLLALVYALGGVAVDFELGARDFLLVYFFTTIGINANVRDLLAGGKPLVILLVVTIVLMVCQALVGVSVATVLGQPGEIGLLGGTVSLIGGHGTAIAWAPRFAEEHGVASALEIGVACATFGLVLASLMGGPIAKFLIDRYDLHPASRQQLDVGVVPKAQGGALEPYDFLDALLAIHLCVVIGVLLNSLIATTGLDLPLFVTCLFAGILVTNLLPASFPRFSGRSWPSRTPAIAFIADLSLGTFLAMSLMSMQLWELIDLAGPMIVILTAQFLLVVAFIFLVVFPVLGRNYDAAVVAAGFGGFALGSTPTAMANMSAVTIRYGASNLAFLIVPLVAAFFIDLFNAMLITTLLGYL